MTRLARKTCKPCQGGEPPLKGQQCELLQTQLPDWEIVEVLNSWTITCNVSTGFQHTVGFICEFPRSGKIQYNCIKVSFFYSVEYVLVMHSHVLCESILFQVLLCSFVHVFSDLISIHLSRRADSPCKNSC